MLTLTFCKKSTSIRSGLSSHKQGCPDWDAGSRQGFNYRKKARLYQKCRLAQSQSEPWRVQSQPSAREGKKVSAAIKRGWLKACAAEKHSEIRILPLVRPLLSRLPGQRSSASCCKSARQVSSSTKAALASRQKDGMGPGLKKKAAQPSAKAAQVQRSRKARRRRAKAQARASPRNSPDCSGAFLCAGKRAIASPRCGNARLPDIFSGVRIDPDRKLFSNPCSPRQSP